MLITAPTTSQRAALRCLDDDALRELDVIVHCQYEICGDQILEKLKEMKEIPLHNIAPADGGLYIYIDLGDNVI